jgi:hypothetical protein
MISPGSLASVHFRLIHPFRLILKAIPHTFPLKAFLPCYQLKLQSRKNSTRSDPVLAGGLRVEFYHSWV